ncbi:MAG: hypothetical protein P8Y70_20900 [Candidatus Lokiarchaeota archaeon]
MTKKKKEECPYCGKMFTYLSRHKCKVKARMEGEEDEKSAAERRTERIEERKKEVTRKLNKDEINVLEIIKSKNEIYFDDLVEESSLERNNLDDVIEVLALQEKVKVRRELINASWSKHIYYIKHFEDEIEVEELIIDKSKPDFVWGQFGKQPCFTCPFTGRCDEENADQFNPHHCPWLTEWIEFSIKGKEYDVNFEEIEENLYQEE